MPGCAAPSRRCARPPQRLVEEPERQGDPSAARPVARSPCANGQLLVRFAGSFGAGYRTTTSSEDSLVEQSPGAHCGVGWRAARRRVDTRGCSRPGKMTGRARRRAVSHFGLAREGSRALQPVEAILEFGLFAHFLREGRAPKGPWSLVGPANETETRPGEESWVSFELNPSQA